MPNLLTLLETHVEGSIPDMAIQRRPPTPLLTHTSHPEHADKKRKRDGKGKNVEKEREVILFKEPEP